MPRNCSSKVDEHGAIKEQINDAGEVSLLSSLGEPAVASKSIAATKGYEEVVCSQQRGDSDRHDSEEKVENGETGFVNILARCAESKDLVGGDSNDHTEEDTKCALPQYRHQEPLFGDISSGLLHEKVQANEQEWETDSIVASGLGRKHMLDALRDTAAELAVADDRGSEHRISRSQASGNDESSAVVGLEHPVHEERTDEPSKSHDGSEEHSD